MDFAQSLGWLLIGAKQRHATLTYTHSGLSKLKLVRKASLPLFFCPIANYFVTSNAPDTNTHTHHRQWSLNEGWENIFWCHMEISCIKMEMSGSHTIWEMVRCPLSKSVHALVLICPFQDKSASKQVTAVAECIKCSLKKKMKKKNEKTDCCHCRVLWEGY